MLKQSSKTKTQQTSNKAGETPSSFPFRNIVGGIAWLTHTRPDIAMAVANVQRRQQNPSQEDECLVKHILRYLKGTTQEGIAFYKNNKVPLFAACDSNFAAPRSRTGYIIFRAGAAVIAKTHLQKLPALHSTEAEYYAATACTQRLIWVRELLKELGWSDDKPSKTQVDNQSTIRIGMDITSNRRTVHLAVRDEFLHHHVQQGHVALEYIPTQENPADILTKAIVGKQFFKHKETMMGREKNDQYFLSKPMD